MRKSRVKSLGELNKAVCTTADLSIAVSISNDQQSTTSSISTHSSRLFLEDLSTTGEASFASVVFAQSTLSTESFTTTMFFKNKLGTIA